MNTFSNTYELYNSTEKFDDLYSNSVASKKCKFCRKTTPEVTFETIPHVIPELFGRNNITSNFECDSCNKMFQKYESDMSTMIQHYLSLLGIKTKNGIPTFQSKKSFETQSTVLKYIQNQRSIFFGKNIEDFHNDKENKIISICFRTKNFRPFFVYKVFLKMGISLLKDDDLKRNQHFLELLNAYEPVMNGVQVWKVFRYMLKTKYYATPKVELYKAKKTLIENNQYPEYTLLISFANITFQFFLPISSKNMEEYTSSKSLTLEIYPSFALEDLSMLREIEFYEIELFETKKVSITDKIKLYYN